MRNHGFTLPELLMALAVTCILLLASQPIGSLLAELHLTSSARDLAATLRFARSNAVLSQTGTTVLALNGSWSNGWQVFRDDNRNAQLDDDEVALIKRSAPLQLKISGNSPVATYIHYSAQGMPELVNGGFQAGSIYFCSPDSSLSPLKMTLSSSGRVRIEEQVDANCTDARSP